MCFDQIYLHFLLSSFFPTSFPFNFMCLRQTNKKDMPQPPNPSPLSTVCVHRCGAIHTQKPQALVSSLVAVGFCYPVTCRSSHSLPLHVFWKRSVSAKCVDRGASRQRGGLYLLYSFLPQHSDRMPACHEQLKGRDDLFYSVFQRVQFIISERVWPSSDRKLIENTERGQGEICSLKTCPIATSTRLQFSMVSCRRREPLAGSWPFIPN